MRKGPVLVHAVLKGVFQPPGIGKRGRILRYRQQAHSQHKTHAVQSAQQVGRPVPDALRSERDPPPAKAQHGGDRQQRQEKGTEAQQAETIRYRHVQGRFRDPYFRIFRFKADPYTRQGPVAFQPQDRIPAGQGQRTVRPGPADTVSLIPQVRLHPRQRPAAFQPQRQGADIPEFQAFPCDRDPVQGALFPG